MLPKKVFYYIVLIIFSALSICHAERLNPEDLVYKGAFRLPNEYSDSYQWKYGGYALAFRPDGDPGGEGDGYPGSLFSVGKRQGAGILRDVSEFSIPQPVISASLGDMNTASTLQSFHDLTQGFFDQVLSGQELNRVRGLVYLEAQPGQSSPKLYWSIWSAYNTEDVNLPSQGYSDMDISSPNAQGTWKLAGYNSKFVSGYLFDIPRNWADIHLNGMYLATGISREGGAFSRGPALFAIAPYQYSNSNPPPNNELPTKPLIFYNSMHDNYPGYNEKDEWRGASWITAGNKEAVIFVGSKGIGSVCYGTGDHCGDPCNANKGYHSYPKEPQMVFYDVSDLEAVAAGVKKPWEVIPYQTLNLADIIPNYSICTQTQGATYDRKNGILYLIQEGGDDSNPLVHVFSIAGGATVLSITNNSLAGGVLNEGYQETLSSYGGVSPYTWSLESGSLPAGLSLSSSGVISGTPILAGTTNFFVKVTDSDSPASTAIKEISLTVEEPPALSINTNNLPNALIGITYNKSLVAQGGVPPYVWSLESGILPSGLTLSSAGVVSGTSTAEGSYSFTVKVVDSAASMETKQLTLAVTDVPLDTVGYWSFDDGSGTVALDSASGGNNLNISGATWSSGHSGFALSFDGQSDYAYRTDTDIVGSYPSKSTGAAEDFTLAAWIRLDKVNTRQPIISKQGHGARGYLFLVEDTNRLSLQVFNNLDNRTDIFSSTTLDAGQWYHVAVSYDYVSDGNSSINLYINGINVGNTDVAVGPVRGNSEAFELGRYYWSNDYNRYMDGAIDDVHVYDRALSVAEIGAVMAGEGGGQVPPQPDVTPPATPTGLQVGH